MSIFQNRTVAIVTGATIIAAAGSTGAVAANLVNSADIRDNSIRSADVRDGALNMRDLRPRVASKIRSEDPQGPAGSDGEDGEKEKLSHLKWTQRFCCTFSRSIFVFPGVTTWKTPSMLSPV